MVVDAPVVLVIQAAARACPALCAALALIILVASAVPAGLAIASGALVSTLVDHGRSGASSAVLGVVVALGVLFLALQLLAPLAVTLAEDLGRHLDRDVSVRVLAAVSRPTSMTSVEDPRVAELLARINARRAEASALDAVVGVVELAVIRVGAVVGTLVLVGYRWWLAALLLGTYGATMVVVSRAYQRALTSSERASDGLRRPLYLQGLVVRPAAAKDVRVFGLGGWLTGLYRAERDRAMGETRRTRGVSGRADLLTGVVVCIAQGATFLLLVGDLAAHHITPGAFTTYAVAATGVLALHMRGPGLLSISRAGDMFRALAELVRRIAPEGGQPLPARPIRFEHTLECRDLGFRYPGSDRWVIRHLNLVIPAGTATAIVGVNGSGKTTLIKLLTGLYQPTEGAVLIDGVDLRELGQASWQRRCAVLFQNWVRWGLPLRDNVLMGAPGAPAHQEELDHVARSSALTEVVEALPRGWDTVLGRQFGGVDLSGGQWQRVGLARALWALRHGARMLVLDEPTSALDARGEAMLYDTMLAAARGRTVVLISHRFSTVRRADRVLVLTGGAISEDGHHDELMAREGGYATMFTVQSRRFAGDGAAR